MKKVVFRLEPEKLKNIKRIAIEKDSTLSNLFIEGIDTVIKKYSSLLK